MCDLVCVLYVITDTQDFTSGYFKVHPPSCEEPILIAGNNWQVANVREPFPALGAQEISTLLARGCPMRSLDVESQESFNLSVTGWSARLADAKATPVNAHFRVQDTSFGHRIAAPVAVSEVDWHFAVPRQGSSSAASSPSTSPSSPTTSHQQHHTSNPDTFGTFFGAGSFQDFTVSPGGKCAWLSVSKGDATVLLIPPTEDNLRGFADWKRSSDPPASRVFLAEHVDQCVRCVVSTTSSLFIPPGWLYALFSEHDCSFYSGFFSMTVSLFGQLRVLEIEASGHTAQAHQQSQTSLSTGWQLSDAVPELWAALCFYVRQFLIPDPSGPHVSEPDKHALVRALPYLRRWSSSPSAIKASDTAVWTPGSLREAQDILDRLEQALSNAMGVTPLRSMAAVSHESSPFDQQRYSSLSVIGGGVQSSMNNRHLQQQLSVSEAEYLYARGADPTLSWPLTDASSVQPVSGFQDMHSLWHYATSSEQSQLPFYTGDLSNDFAAPNSTGVPTNFTFSLPIQTGGGFPVAPHPHQHQQHHLGAGNDTYMDAMRQQLLGPTLPVPTASHQQQHGHASFESVLSSSIASNSGVGGQDVLVRHRASCHRCGNLRKKNVRCPQCPHIFCQKCAEKMVEEHGEAVFVDGCPVCKEQCCCGKNRTILCTRKVGFSILYSYCIDKLVSNLCCVFVCCSTVPLLQEMSFDQEAVHVSSSLLSSHLVSLLMLSIEPPTKYN